MKEILNVIHNTIYQFIDVCSDNEEVPMSDKDKLLLEVNKAICNNLKALEQQPCDDCVRELIREFDHKHPTLFADYMQEFNSHPISEIIEYMWDMHDLIEDIKYRLPNEGGEEE